MNLLLLEEDDFVAHDRARLVGRRHEHARDVLTAQVGDAIRVGRVGGRVGQGRVVAVDAALELECTFDQEPPQALPITLVLALPRPPVLRRVLQHVTAMGIKHVVLLHSRRVEKSYWTSHALRPADIRSQLVLGLEQAGDTILPTVDSRRRFRPFVEDELATLVGSSVALLGDVDGQRLFPTSVAGPATVIVGPEGGFIPFEIDLIEQRGARRVSLGPRPLRVETAVVGLCAIAASRGSE